MTRPIRSLMVFGCLVALVGLTVWTTPRVGAIEHQPEVLWQVMTHIRIPALKLAMLAGAGLALAGMTFQSVFRNPLATPFTLGVSSGASLAMTIALVCGMQSHWLFGTGQVVVAMTGAVAVVLLVYGVAQLRRESSTSTLLLAGVSINFICGAGIILMQYLAQEHESKEIVYWLIGSVEASSPSKWQATRVLCWIMGPCCLLLWGLHRELDLLMMGEAVAAGRGLNVRRVRLLAYFCASLLTAAVVSVCGPIAFIGLLVPHLMRSLVGPNHGMLLPACLLFGMAMLPICDCIARNLLAWTTQNNSLVLPVGVVTNVLGGLFFLVVLIRQPPDRPMLS